MPIEIKIPAVGESITEVQINEWLKSEGDVVKQDEALAVIDSEKATLDLPAPNAGKLTKILHQAGETVAVGTVVAHMEAEGEAGKSEAAPKPEAKVEAKPAAKVYPPSDLTPQLVKRVHQLYEELGREEVRAVQELEQAEQEMHKDKPQK